MTAALTSVMDFHRVASNAMRDGIVCTLRALRDGAVSAAEASFAEAELASAKRNIVGAAEFKAAGDAYLEVVDMITAEIARTEKVFGGGR